ncbi:SAF domain-containing protein [Serinicoccus sp. LYQ131]|uniref:SAF domain-containing protein n=1 Tax=Serinicoccus sp. LYQ131 TaxID=3378797 RepID=UPI003853BA80
MSRREHRRQRPRAPGSTNGSTRSFLRPRRWPARRWSTPGLRRVAAAVLAGVTVAGGLHLVLGRPAPDDVPVVLAARQLSVGQVLDAADVEVVLLPPRARPAGALTDLGAAHGARLVTPVGAGEVLTSSDLRTTGLLAGMPPGTVAVFVPLADEAVALAATPGDLVDVHGPDGAVVAREGLVLRSPQPGTSGLWLAVDTGTAQELAGARGADPLGAALQVALRPPSGEQGHPP